MPTQAAEHIPESPKSWAIPVDLDKPLPREQILREIAPSRTVGEAYVSSDTDEDGRQRGIAIHRMLEYLSQTPQTEQQAIAIANELGVQENDTEFQAWWQEAQQIINSPKLAFLFADKNYQQAWSEVPIQYQQNERIVYGIIDRLVINKDEVIVVDYKTHQSATDKNVYNLAEKYRTQMDYYLEGVRQLWPDLKARGLLLFTACGEVFEY
jgi:ATP-dependent exoDNAse (exonuclease V) beta subunit